MFGIKDEISSGIGRTMKPERSDVSDLRWKKSETKADEPNRNYSAILATLQIILQGSENG
jgi:hypothetical protein